MSQPPTCPPVRPPPSRPPNPNACHECSGYVEVDHREGNRVCILCGLVQDRSSTGVAPPFVETPVTVAPRASGAGDAPPRVSQCLFSRCDSPSGRRRSAHWDDLQHYNHFTRLMDDDLVRMDRLLATWTDGGISGSVRVAAALLYLALRRQFPDEQAVRRNVRLHEAVTPVHSVTPEHEFECVTCGRGAHTMKGARFCCRGGGRRRPTSSTVP